MERGIEVAELNKVEETACEYKQKCEKEYNIAKTEIEKELKELEYYTALVEDWVVKKALQFLPLSLRLLLSEDDIRKIVRLLFHKAKDYLDNGKLDNSL